MPLVTVSMFPGRTDQQKSEFAKAVTRAATDILKAQDRHVIVVFDEKPPEHWFLAGKPL